MLISNEQHPPARLSRGPVLLGLALAFIAVWIGVALFLHWRDLPPHVTIPSPTLPSPNACDDFERAYKLMRDRDEVDYALEPTHEHETPADHDYTPAERAAIVRENAAALRAVDQGLHHQFLQPPVRSMETMGLEPVGEHPEVARLLCLASSVRAERGDWSAAARDDLDCIQMGMEITHGAGMTNLLIGSAIQSIGVAQLRKKLTHLSARTADGAARRLQSIIRQNEPLSQAMQEEEWTLEAVFLEEMQDGHLWAYGRPDDQSLGESVREWLSRQQWSQQQILDHYSRYMDRVIVLFRRPYPLRKPLPTIQKDPINFSMTPTLESVSATYTRILASDDLLVVELALHSYDLEHRSYPVRLKELVPGYLPLLPIDPFSVNAPLLYHRRGTGYVLYSVGPDGRDDGGRPIPSKNADGSHAAIDANSKGDIVTTGQ